MTSSTSWWPCEIGHVRRSTKGGAANTPTEATRHRVWGCLWEAVCGRGEWVPMIPKSWWTGHVGRSTKGGAANAPTKATRHWVRGCSWEVSCGRSECQWCPSLDELATLEEAPRKGQRTLPPKLPDTESRVVCERRCVEEVSAYDAQSWWTCHVRRSTKEGAANAPTEATRHWVWGCLWEAACGGGEYWWVPMLMAWRVCRADMGSSEKGEKGEMKRLRVMFMLLPIWECLHQITPNPLIHLQFYGIFTQMGTLVKKYFLLLLVWYSNMESIDEQQQARKIYSHQKCVWVVRSVCESSAKASNGWDTSEIERTGGPGCTEYSTYTYRAYCSTQDNKAYTNGK